METAGSDYVIAGGLEYQNSNGEAFILLFLNRLAFLPIANTMNVLRRNLDITEKH